MSPAGRSRSSAAGWPARGSSRSRSPGTSAIARGAARSCSVSAGCGAAQRRHEQVDVDAEQPLGCLATHRVGDTGAHVAALGDVAGVAEAAHQLRPRPPMRPTSQPELGRLGGEAVAGQGGQHEVERVLGAPAVRGRVGERADRLEQLDDRTGPAVRHDQRQGVRVRRPHVEEVDVHPVDLGHELRQRVQPRLAPAPVVLGRPVAAERLHRRQLHALRAVVDQFPRGPARRGEAAAQVGERLLREVDVERADGAAGLLFDGGHGGLPLLEERGGKSRTGRHGQGAQRHRRGRGFRDGSERRPGSGVAQGRTARHGGRVPLGASPPETRGCGAGHAGCGILRTC